MGFPADQKHSTQPSLVIRRAEAHLRKPQTPSADAMNSLNPFSACLAAWFYVVLMVATDELLLSCSI